MNTQGLNAQTYVEQNVYNKLIMGNRIFAGVVGLAVLFFGEVIIKKTFDATQVMLAEGFEIVKNNT